MDKTYQPSALEQKWSDFWQEKHFSVAQTHAERLPYCIMLPPPNVTGTLHMGHGFQQTLMDVMIRTQRMLGRNTLWQGGTDHAGIATQMVVERQLAEKGQTRYDLGREKFLERVWEWSENSGKIIKGQIRRMGASIDWSRERFSMDEGLSTATNEEFIRLYNEGLIYRGQRLVNWDPALKTAVSDLEVITEPEPGSLWHLRYPLADGSGDLIVCTTRPETMLGDVAVAVNPSDHRYQHLIGQKIRLPLTGREIPIIADDYVSAEFGSGCVKITPAHDFNDYEMGQRHQLPMINIFTLDAHLNDHVPQKYRGLERFEARKAVLKDLEDLGLLAKIEDYTVNIPRGDRSNVVIEPLLTDQWFMKMSPLAKPAIAAVTSGKIKFVPKNWEKTYLQWLENIQDWCISRQLWWGHRIPVWYDENNNDYVGQNEQDVRERNKLGPEIKLRQDEDVLDTWFSSALWPFATLGWPKNTEELQTFYPTDVLVTGFDIIFFWVARMVMLGLHLVGDIPFHTVYITGLIRDRHGKKMSKSKGNILDPIDLIDGIDLESLIKKRTSGLMQPKMAAEIKKNTKEEFPNGIAPHGTDALRFTFCALATHGRDINFDMGRIEGYRNFCNKIWNAARYVIMNQGEVDARSASGEGKLSLADLWIKSRLQDLINLIHETLAQYRFDLLSQAIYEFTWNEYCDWYLELSKVVLNNPNSSEAQLRGTRKTLLEVFETLLRLMHPIMPFITEEIWQKIAPMLNIHGESIMVAPYPQVDGKAFSPESVEKIQWLKNIVMSIRNLRSEVGVSPAQKISLIFNKGNAEDLKNISELESYIFALARVDHYEFSTANQSLPASATAIVNALEIHLPLADLIDKDAELKRLLKEIEKLQKDLQLSESKLQNPNYVEKAPKEVVEKEREKLEKSQITLEKLKKQYVEIEQC